MQQEPRPPASFCHCFKNKGQWYVYDVNTNNLYKIDPVLAHVLPLWGPQTDDEIIERLKGQFSSEKILTAIDEIKTARETQGLFLPCYPKEITSPQVKYAGQAMAQERTVMVLTVTEQCNLRCRYCMHTTNPHWNRPHTNRKMSIDTAMQAIDFYEKHTPDPKYRRISFYGGEPILEMDLIRTIVDEVRSRPSFSDVTFVIDTNGTLLTDPDVIKFICDNKIDVQISLDGPREIHDRYRVSADGRGSYDRVIAGIEAVLRYDRSAAKRMIFIATLGPPYDLIAVSDYFKNFPVFKKFDITSEPVVLCNYADIDHCDIKNSPENDETFRAANHTAATNQYINACATCTRDTLGPVVRVKFDQILIDFHRRRRDPIPDRFAPGGCCLPGDRLHVHTDGAIHICDRIGNAFPIGHVSTGIDLKAIDRVFDDFHRSIRDRCNTCWALRLCKLCFTSMIYSWTPDHSREPEVPQWLCDSFRNRMLWIFRTYLAIKERNNDALEFLNDQAFAKRY